MSQYCKAFLDDYNKKHFKKKGRRVSQINSNVGKHDDKRSNNFIIHNDFFYNINFHTL